MSISSTFRVRPSRCVNRSVSRMCRFTRVL
jgi:hypothetical protein